MTISDQLRHLIRLRNLSGYEVSVLTGVNRSVVNRFLAGDGLTVASLDRIADSLGLHLAESAGRRRPPTARPRAARPTGPAPDELTPAECRATVPAAPAGAEAIDA